MIRATIGVITNVRLDHTEVMGRDLAVDRRHAREHDSRRAACSSPARAQCAPLFRRTGRRPLGTRVVDAGRGRRPRRRARWRALARRGHRARPRGHARARHRRRAWRGAASRSAPRDPGATRRGCATLRGGEIRWLDATAANDPESLDLLLDEFGPWREAMDERAAGRARILVYHHRDDRAPRLDCFAEHSQGVCGGRPPGGQRRTSAARPSGDGSRGSGRRAASRSSPPRTLPGWLSARAPATGGLLRQHPRPRRAPAARGGGHPWLNWRSASA